MEVVNLIFPDRNQLYFEIACVDEPAIESEAYMFNDVNFQFKEVEGEEGLMMGYLMIAEKEILRLDAKRGAYKVKFPKKTIDMMIENFQLHGLAKNMNLQHQTGHLLDGVFVRNHWQIDSKKGIVAPKGFKTEADGSWFIVVKCENEDVKQKFKDKVIRGFSLESRFIEEAIDKYFKHDDQKVNDPFSFITLLSKKFNNMKFDLKEFGEALVAFFSKEHKFEDLLLVDGVTKVAIEPEVAVGSAFWIYAEDGTKIPAPVIPEPYELSDGRKITVEVEGVIASVMDAAVEGEEMDEAGNPKAKEAAAQSEAVKRLIERVEKVSEFESQIADQKTKITELETANQEIKVAFEAQTKKTVELETKYAGLETLITESFAKLMGQESKKPAAPERKSFTMEKAESPYPWLDKLKKQN